ncbi:MAG: polyprenol monophosphomannose synthase [bacterium]
MVNKTLIFTATYNESENIVPLCTYILGLDPGYDMLVVDDNSPDGTGRLLDELVAKNPRLKVIHRSGKMGLGSAHEYAMKYAVQLDYEALVTMDADFSHNPEDIPRLLQAIENVDFVTGSRYMDGGTCNYSGYRRVVSICANWWARRLLGIPLHEMTTSFRVFRVDFLRCVDYGAIKSNGYSFFMEIVFRLSRMGARMSEVPINFSDRRAGASKIPPFEIFNGLRHLLYLTCLRLFWRKEPVDIKALVVPLMIALATCAP